MKIKLTYLGIKGLTEPIRLCLFMSKIPFEDERISYEEIEKRRASLPYGQVPVLKVDGEVYSQSNAILRWAGRQGKLYTDGVQLSCDAVLSCIEDINKSLTSQWYGHVLPRCPGSGKHFIPLTAQQKEDVEKHLNQDILPGHFSMLAGQLGSNLYFCGSTLTIADLKWYVVGSGFMDGSYCEGISKTVLDNYPSLVKLVERVGQHPKVEEWNQMEH